MDFLVEGKLKTKGIDFMEAVKARCEGRCVKCGILELVCTEEGIKIKGSDGGARNLIPADLTLVWEIYEEKNKDNLSSKAFDKHWSKIEDDEKGNGNLLYVKDVKESLKEFIDCFEKHRYCTYCGHPMLKNDHFCEECEERISVPADNNGLMKFIKEKAKEIFGERLVD